MFDGIFRNSGFILILESQNIASFTTQSLLSNSVGLVLAKIIHKESKICVTVCVKYTPVYLQYNGPFCFIYSMSYSLVNCKGWLTNP